jgi:hypothetical protein
LSSILKTAVIIRCYYLTEFLPYVIDQCSFADRIIIVNSRFKNVDLIQDDTYDIFLKKADAKIEYSNAYSGMEEHEVLNECVERFKRYDWIFIIDADEIILKQDWNEILKVFRFCKDKEKNFLTLQVIDYADLKYIYKPRNHRPLIAIRPNEINFYDGRSAYGLGNEAYYFSEIFLHHFGFCFPKEKMDWKIKNYWNNGNKNEISQIMKTDKFLVKIEPEIKKIFDNVKF